MKLKTLLLKRYLTKKSSFFLTHNHTIPNEQNNFLHLSF